MSCVLLLRGIIPVLTTIGIDPRSAETDTAMEGRGVGDCTTDVDIATGESNTTEVEAAIMELRLVCDLSSR